MFSIIMMASINVGACRYINLKRVIYLSKNIAPFDIHRCTYYVMTYDRQNNKETYTSNIPLVHCPTCSSLLPPSHCQIAHNFINSSVRTSDYVRRTLEPKFSTKKLVNFLK